MSLTPHMHQPWPGIEMTKEAHNHSLVRTPGGAAQLKKR